MNDVIETWKLDLERLLWSYHENGRPDGKTGVIGNPKTIEEFVETLLHNIGKKRVKEENEQTEVTIRSMIAWSQQNRAYSQDPVIKNQYNFLIIKLDDLINHLSLRQPKEIKHDSL